MKGRLFLPSLPSCTILPFIVTTVASTDVNHYIVLEWNENIEWTSLALRHLRIQEYQRRQLVPIRLAEVYWWTEKGNIPNFVKELFWKRYEWGGKRLQEGRSVTRNAAPAPDWGMPNCTAFRTKSITERRGGIPCLRIEYIVFSTHVLSITYWGGTGSATSRWNYVKCNCMEGAKSFPLPCLCIRSRWEIWETA